MYRCFASQLILALLLTGQVWAVELKRASLLDTYVWRNTSDWFGGFSAIHIAEGGERLIAISDRSRLITARVNRDGDKIIGIEILGQWPILSSNGRVLKGRAGDSEGIAVASDESIYISFEGVHRIAHYAAHNTNTRVLPRPREFLNLDRNGSFEALAIDNRGRLYTLTEKSRTLRGDIPIYRWDGSRWSTPFVLPARGKFLPVAAEFGPDGRFYVLERAVAFIGFRTRLRRWEIVNDAPQSEEVLLETGTGLHDNLEGLSIWRDGQMRLRATMISDDNFLALQRTEVVEYLLPD